MMIFVETQTGKGFYLNCKSTHTIAHLKVKMHAIIGLSPDEQKHLFDDELWSNNFTENKTLAEFGVEEGSRLLVLLYQTGGGGGEIERPPLPRPENNYLYYADAFKSGWREEHAKVLLHLLLELCKDGTLSEGNVTDEAWLRIQNGLNNSTNCSFQIDFLKERLSDYKKLYSTLTETNSLCFHWDREKRTINHVNSRWREDYPELLLLCGAYIPYFDTLEEVCLLLNTRQSSEQQVSETSININHEGKLGDQDIPRPSNIRTMFRMSRQG